MMNKKQKAGRHKNLCHDTSEWAACALCGLFLIAIFVLLPVSLAAKKKSSHDGAPVSKVKVTARQIDSFYRSGKQTTQFGKLRFLGGLELTSDWRGFGGWSDLVVDKDGRRFLAISDEGHWLRATLQYQGLKPVGIANASRGDLHALSGRVLKGKRERDAEGAVLLDGTLENGSLLISFERIHRIGRFKALRQGIVGPSQYLTLPREVRTLKRNKGIESVGVIRAGRLKGSIIAVAERYRRARDRNSRGRPGWIFTANGTQRFYVKDRGDMDITSLAGLPGGDVLLLERRFRWSEGIKIRLRCIHTDGLRPGEVVDGKVILEAGLDFEIDNMEGLSVHRGPGGETILTLISDDNFNKLLQRTILLQFQLETSDVSPVM